MNPTTDTIFTAFAAQPDWMADASCATVDPDLFFPEGAGKGTLRLLEAEAKAICGSCPVREKCLTWALDTDERYGVWGGMTEDERAELRKASA